MRQKGKTADDVRSLYTELSAIFKEHASRLGFSYPVRFLFCFSWELDIKEDRRKVYARARACVGVGVMGGDVGGGGVRVLFSFFYVSLVKAQVSILLLLIARKEIVFVRNLWML